MDSDEEVNSIMSGSDDGFGEDMDSSVDFGAGGSTSQRLYSQAHETQARITTSTWTMKEILASTRRTKISNHKRKPSKLISKCTARRTSSRIKPGKSTKLATSSDNLHNRLPFSCAGRDGTKND